MIGYLRGLLLESSSEYCVICAGGVGYTVSIPDSTFQSLPMQLETEVSLWIHSVWREQTGPQLYGFSSRSERDLFNTLLSLNGVGPKTALAIVGHVPLEQLLQAVQSGNPLALNKIPGVGKKTAERILIDLQGKLEGLAISPQVVQPQLPLVGDAIRALTHLGYSPMAAERAVRAAAESESQDLGRLITTALQKVSASR